MKFLHLSLILAFGTTPALLGSGAPAKKRKNPYRIDDQSREDGSDAKKARRPLLPDFDEIDRAANAAAPISENACVAGSASALMVAHMAAMSPADKTEQMAVVQRIRKFLQQVDHEDYKPEQFSKDFSALMLNPNDVILTTGGQDRDTLLGTIASYGTVEDAQRLQAVNPEQFKKLVNAVNRKGQTPLYIALAHAYRPSRKMVQFLVENGADVNIKATDSGRAPLHWAVEGGHIAIARYLITHGARNNRPDKDGQRPSSLVDAIKHPSTRQFMKDLISSKPQSSPTSASASAAAAAAAPAPMEVDAQADAKRASAAQAAQPVDNPLAILAGAASQAAQAPAQSSGAVDENAADILATMATNSRPVKVRKSRRVQSDDESEAPVMSEGGNLDSTAASSASSSIDLTSDDVDMADASAPIASAEADSKSAAAKPKIGSGRRKYIQLKRFIDKYEKASKKELRNFADDFAKLLGLLEPNAYLKVRDNNKATVLHYLAVHGNAEQALKLQQISPDEFTRIVPLRGEHERTALFEHVAFAQNPTIEFAQLLVEQGVDIDAQEEEIESTALHEAVKKGHVGLVEFLLQHNASQDIKDKHGHTPYALVAHVKDKVLRARMGALFKPVAAQDDASASTDATPAAAVADEEPADEESAAAASAKPKRNKRVFQKLAEKRAMLLERQAIHKAMLLSAKGQQKQEQNVQPAASAAAAAASVTPAAADDSSAPMDVDTRAVSQPDFAELFESAANGGGASGSYEVIGNVLYSKGLNGKLIEVWCKLAAPAAVVAQKPAEAVVVPAAVVTNPAPVIAVVQPAPMALVKPEKREKVPVVAAQPAPAPVAQPVPMVIDSSAEIKEKAAVSASASASAAVPAPATEPASDLGADAFVEVLLQAVDTDPAERLAQLRNILQLQPNLGFADSNGMTLLHLGAQDNDRALLEEIYQANPQKFPLWFTTRTQKGSPFDLMMRSQHPQGDDLLKWMASRGITIAEQIDPAIFAQGIKPQDEKAKFLFATWYLNNKNRAQEGQYFATVTRSLGKEGTAFMMDLMRKKLAQGKK